MEIGQIPLYVNGAYLLQNRPLEVSNNRFYHVLIKCNGCRLAVAVPHLQGQPDVLNKGHKVIVPLLWREHVGPALGFCFLFLLILRFDFILPSVCGPLCRFFRFWKGLIPPAASMWCTAELVSPARPVLDRR